MKRIFLMIMAAVLMVSCGTARQAGQKPVKTYVQPGTELLDAPDVIRAWAVGTSDSKTVARKKAMAAASAELSRILNSVVATTVDDYSVALSDNGATTASKEYLSKKINVVSEQVLVGVRPIFDQWEGPDADGMYRNYIVLELPTEEFIKKIAESVEGVDAKLLSDIFIKTVNSAK